jgi:hypothetical protein
MSIFGGLLSCVKSEDNDADETGVVLDAPRRHEESNRQASQSNDSWEQTLAVFERSNIYDVGIIGKTKPFSSACQDGKKADSRISDSVIHGRIDSKPYANANHIHQTNDAVKSAQNAQANVFDDDGSNVAWTVEQCQQIIDDRSDPVGKFLREENISAELAIKLNLMERLQYAPFKQRCKVR